MELNIRVATENTAANIETMMDARVILSKYPSFFLETIATARPKAQKAIPHHPKKQSAKAITLRLMEITDQSLVGVLPSITVL